LRLQRGQKVEITETFVAPALFALLSDDEKQTINNLKMKALDLWITRPKDLKNKS
jgi:hypothetical protein